MFAVRLRCRLQDARSGRFVPHGEVVMQAFIVGDSQAEGAGAYLEKRLSRDGWAVKRSAKHGANSAQVLELAKAQAGERFDLVVVFSGSTAGGAPAAREIPKLFGSSKIYWYGSGPATLIGSLSTARAVFGKKVVGEQYWFESGEAAAREARNAEMRKLLPQNVQYVDWRSLSLPSVVQQPSGVAFPVLNDGIHITGNVAAAAFNETNWPPPAVSQTGLLVAVAVGLGLWFAWRRGWLL